MSGRKPTVARRPPETASPMPVNLNIPGVIRIKHLPPPPDTSQYLRPMSEEAAKLLKFRLSKEKAKEVQRLA